MPPTVGTFTLAFGLVAIPVQMLSATRSHKVSFRQVHVEDMGRVRYRKTCELEERVLDQSDIGRAYEAPDGSLVPVTDEELDEMPLPTSKTIEISGFLDLGSVPGEQFDTPYFLAPSSEAARKPYVLMREALARAGKGAVGKYALRGSGEALALIYPQGDVLVAHRLHWPDELRLADDAAPRADVSVSDEELVAALDYIRATGDVEMQEMHDEYARAVQELIEAKIEHHAPPAAPSAAARKDAGVTDLMGALKAAAGKARADRGADADQGEDADVHHLDDRRPAKKAAKRAAAKSATKTATKAAKKTEPKNAAAGRTAAEKTSPKKTSPKKPSAKKTAAKKTPRGKQAG